MYVLLRNFGLSDKEIMPIALKILVVFGMVRKRIWGRRLSRRKSFSLDIEKTDEMHLNKCLTHSFMRTKSKQKKPSVMEKLGLVDQQGKLVANPPKDVFDDFFQYWIASWGFEGQGVESPQTIEMVEGIEAMNRAIKNALYGAISCSRLPVFCEICSEILCGEYFE